jgi:hypothetical protein
MGYGLERCRHGNERTILTRCMGWAPRSPVGPSGRSSLRCARPIFSAWGTMSRTVVAPHTRRSFYNYKGKKQKLQGCCVARQLYTVRQHVDSGWLCSLDTSWCTAAVTDVARPSKPARPVQTIIGGCSLIRCASCWDLPPGASEIGGKRLTLTKSEFREEAAAPAPSGNRLKLFCTAMRSLGLMAPIRTVFADKGPHRSSPWSRICPPWLTLLDPAAPPTRSTIDQPQASRRTIAQI